MSALGHKRTLFRSSPSMSKESAISHKRTCSDKMIASQKVFNYDPELFKAVLANGCIDKKAAIPLVLLAAIIKALTEHERRQT